MIFYKKSSKLILIILLCGLFLTVQNNQIKSQLPTREINTVSPNSAQFGTFGSVPVGLFTGSAQENIPIYELKTKNLTVPITLNYSSNGLVVDKIASWVGYDWNLDAGGVINLSIKGKRDGIWGVVEVPSNIGYDYILRNFLLDHPSGEFQPDIFSYNFFGYSGKFFYSASGLRTFPYRELKITQISAGPRFEIITPDGIKYIFDARENFDFYYLDYPEIYPTSWFLTSIIHPSGDQVTFHYSKLWASSYTGVSQTVDKILWWDCAENPCGDFWSFIPKAHGQRIESVYLDSITTSGGGTVIFQKSGNRTDYHDGKRLDKIIIKNSHNLILKTVDFVYAYIEGNANWPKANPLNYYGIQGLYYDTEVNYRMFLNSVEINDKNNSEIFKYSFQYYDLDQLPSRLSLSQDHWGYFNGAINLEYFVPSGCTSYPQFMYIGGNRNSNGNYSKNGLLKRIDYPTGGYSIIEYEPNRSMANEVGGNRVKKTMTYKESSSSPIIKKYYYNDRDDLSISFGYWNDPTTYYFREYNFYRPCITAPDGVVQTCHYGRLYSNSQASLYYNNNSTIVYPFITISHGEDFEAGGETHGFFVARDLEAENLIPSYDGEDVIPTEYTNLGYYTGTKASEAYFKKNGQGQFVDIKTVAHAYNFNDPRHSSDYLAISVQSKQRPDPGFSGWDELKNWDVVKYSIVSRWDHPEYDVVTEYDDNGNAFITETTYNYAHPMHIQLSSETRTNSRGESIKTQYYYPQDYTTSSYNIPTLIDKHILSKIIDQRTTNITNNTLSSVEQFKYDAYGQVTDYYNADLFNSQNDFSFDSGNPYKANHKESFSYDGNHNLISSTPESNYTTSYVWGYNSVYPIIKAENASPSILQSAVNNSLPSGFYSLEQLLTSANGINNLLTDSQKNLWKAFCSNLMGQSTLSGAMISLFTYEPQIGMTSETNPNGIMKFYEYDSFGRLSLIKDHDGRILKTYEYHYKQ